jgi:uncharacterized membrane protein
LVGGPGRALLGAAAILVATCGYAIGPMVIKTKLSDRDPIGAVALSLIVAAVLLTPVALAAPPSRVPPGEAVGSLVVLGLVCSALAFVLFFTLIADIGPGRASVVTYLNPAVAVLLGVVVLGEEVTAGAVAGLLLILAGSWLSTDGRLPPGPLRRRAQPRRSRRSTTSPTIEPGGPPVTSVTAGNHQPQRPSPAPLTERYMRARNPMPCIGPITLTALSLRSTKAT